MSASFRVRELAIRFKNDSMGAVLRYCVDLVRQSGDDRALRSELVQMIIGRAVTELLPLSSPEAVRSTRRRGNAAWIADGVPEAEDFVRFHRMWASNADQPVFGGNWQWRAFFGAHHPVYRLPLMNHVDGQARLAGPAHWPGHSVNRRSAKGPFQSQNRIWFLVTRNAYIQPVHEKIQAAMAAGQASGRTSTSRRCSTSEEAPLHGSPPPTERPTSLAPPAEVRQAVPKNEAPCAPRPSRRRNSPPGLSIVHRLRRGAGQGTGGGHPA